MERRLSLRQFAEAVDLNHSSLARIELGDSFLNCDHMLRFGAVLQTAPADLLNESEGGLSTEEREIITILRGLPQANREALMAAVRSQLPFCSA